MNVTTGQPRPKEQMDGFPPLPPEELRRLVTSEERRFDIRPDAVVSPDLPDQLYDSVFEFGCGCGRIARQLMCQEPKPRRYLGVDLHPGMIAWCQSNLTTYDGAFQFLHHDVYDLALGADNSHQPTAPFPAESGEFSLVLAHSIFTHLHKEQVEFYLRETARILTPDGVARTAWFLFDKATFPMMLDFQVCLFINEIHPANAVIYDWRWLLDTVRNSGLCVSQVTHPSVRGREWEIVLRRRSGDSLDSFFAHPESLAYLCGSGFEAGSPDKGAQQCPVVHVDPIAPPPRIECGTGVRLSFTGDLTEDEFKNRCSQFDGWYHSYYFQNGFSIRGDYDIGADIASYGFPESMEGMDVLDVGTGSGWFAHYFEQKGARVVTVDARGYCDFDEYGRHYYPPVDEGGREPDRVDQEDRPVYDSPVSPGFWIMKSILKSKARFRNARIYQLCPELFEGRKFDLVFLGAILCHVRDPIGALMAARSVCRHKLIATVPTVLGETSSDILPRQYLPYTDADKISWWLPNEACLRHWFLASGFPDVDAGRQVRLTADLLRLTETGRPSNGDQILRLVVACANQGTSPRKGL